MEKVAKDPVIGTGIRDSNCNPVLSEGRGSPVKAPGIVGVAAAALALSSLLAPAIADHGGSGEIGAATGIFSSFVPSDYQFTWYCDDRFEPGDSQAFADLPAPRLYDPGPPEVIGSYDPTTHDAIPTCHMRDLNTPADDEGLALDVATVANGIRFVPAGEVVENAKQIKSSSWGDILCVQKASNGSDICILSATVAGVSTSGRRGIRIGSLGASQRLVITNDGSPIPGPECPPVEDAGAFAVDFDCSGELALTETALTAPSGPFTAPRIGWRTRINTSDAGSDAAYRVTLAPGRTWELNPSGMLATGVIITGMQVFAVFNTPWFFYTGGGSGGSTSP